MFDPSDQLERISKKKKKKTRRRRRDLTGLQCPGDSWSKAISSSLQIQEQVFCFLFLATLPGLWDKIEPGSLAVKAQSSNYWITREFPETFIFFFIEIWISSWG